MIATGRHFCTGQCVGTRLTNRNSHTLDSCAGKIVFAIDYPDELSGETFYVQLKGQKNVRHARDGKHVKFTLDSYHARYYVEKVKDLPVFLVLADTTSKEAWWLFLQSYLYKHLKWQSQNSFTIDIPKKNKLQETEKLENAVRSANTWIRTQHPTSIPDTVSAYKNRLEKLDQRFKYSVSYNESGVLTSIEPRNEPVNVRLTINGESQTIREKVKDLIDRGKKVRLEPGEFEFQGSPLFIEHSSGPVELQWSGSHQGTATIFLYDESKKEIAQLSEISGTYTGGMSEWSFEHTMPKMPISVVAPVLNSSGCTFELKILLNAWNGIDILQLPFFEKVKCFLASANDAKYVAIEFSIDGNLLVKSLLSPFKLPNAPFLSQLIGSLVKARRIFQRAGLHPTWEISRFDEDFFDTVEKTHALLFEGGVRQKMSDQSLRFKINRSSLNQSLFQQPPKPELLKLSSELKANILDENIPLGVVAEDFSDVIVREVDPGSSGETVEIDVTTTPLTLHSMYIFGDAPQSMTSQTTQS